MNTICELTKGQRVAYRFLAPLIMGGCLLAAFGFLLDDFGDRDINLAFRLVVATGLLGFAVFLSSRISRVKAWVRLAPHEIYFRNLWSGREQGRAITEIESVKFSHQVGGAVSTCRISFADGSTLDLEGRFGPGAHEILLAFGRPRR